MGGSVVDAAVCVGLILLGSAIGAPASGSRRLDAPGRGCRRGPHRPQPDRLKRAALELRAQRTAAFDASDAASRGAVLPGPADADRQVMINHGRPELRARAGSRQSDRRRLRRHPVVGPADVAALAVHIMTNTALTDAGPPPRWISHRLPECDAARLGGLAADHGVEVRRLGGEDVEQGGQGVGVLVPGKAGVSRSVGVLAQPSRCAPDEVGVGTVAVVVVPLAGCRHGLPLRATCGAARGTPRVSSAPGYPQRCLRCVVRTGQAGRPSPRRGRTAHRASVVDDRCGWAAREPVPSGRLMGLGWPCRAV
jgi:hypothetical protein